MNLRDQLREFEGFENEAYPDPLTNGDPWTIGVGHTGPEVFKGLVWSDEKIWQTLDADIAEKSAEVFKVVPWAKDLNEPRQAVVIGMAFQLGTRGMLGFKNTLKAMQEGRYNDAADGMLKSKWAIQTPKRVKRLANQMKTGEWS
jgi:lysozyme